ncbi:hypothetical protein CesoFtcFv8_020549 [Champsocephalus esox]|uniref:CDT1 Geminin-binding domain-containing protein n=1 Tax=Champsocephalus esox TaxID=159716 RepID=A0AAN8BBN7_9TELE|nr:hypothetical protein CesoFtcFv8_020549 [Champsocephalus esox]
MSQARVTDFFSQRKKGIAEPVKAGKPSRSTAVGRGSAGITSNVPRSRSLHNEGDLRLSSSVHEEFVRMIDEASELDPGSCVVNPAKDSPSSPRTPKRTSADTDFDLGSVLFSAIADHSTAKKRRHAVAGSEAKAAVQKAPKRKARKKLVLPQDSPQAAAQPREETPLSAPAASVSGHNEKHLNLQTPPQKSPVPGRNTDGGASKALGKEDLAALKSRLQRIKKLAERIPSPASAPTPSSPAASALNSTPTPAISDAKTLESTVAQAKELAVKAQRRRAEREAKQGSPSEAPSQDSTEQPAYQRYHNLAQAAAPGLSLPYQYKVLADMFRSMDTVVAMLYNRCETTTFTKLKQGVQDMMHKRFEESHVGQIKMVFPEAYTFRQERNIPTFTSGIKKGSYQLTVEPVVPSDQNEPRPVFSASHLLERRRIFHRSLVSVVKQHHKAFLSTLVPVVTVPDDRLTRWHPRFNVDTVPVISTGLLPQPPHTEKLSTAQEVLDRARSLVTPKMEKALAALALKTEETKEPTPPQNPPTPPPPSETQAPSALKGVSQSLLERVRAKEAQKLQAAMTRNPIQEGRLLMMSRLPELARILRNVFVAEKKPALIMEVACNKMVASFRSALSSGEMEKHIRLLAEVAGEWLKIHPIRKDFYLKLNKNMELNIVLDQLSSRLREEERT